VVSICPIIFQNSHPIPKRKKNVILAIQEAEIRRITVQSQPGQIVHKTLYQKNPTQNRAGGMAQGVGPEFKL
jgi:hypothetical protein